MTQKEFEENIVFERYKDTSFRSSKDFRKQVKEYRNIDVREVYTKITNYQIKTYGNSLCINREDKIDLNRLRNNSNLRKKSSRKTRGTYENAKEKRWRVY